MGQILCVRYIKGARLEYVESEDNNQKIGDSVIVENDRGQELGKVVRIINKDEFNKDIDLKKLCRVATPEDLKKIRKNEEEATEMLKFAKKSANTLGLGMKFLAAEYNLDKSKIVFYFTAEDRIDFRELVKILAAEVKTRVELKQIGPRDEVRLYESIGMCGKETCCRTHLKEFKSVTIKDAKEQGLQINMDKISGCCRKTYVLFKI